MTPEGKKEQPKILLVDDNESLLTSMGQVLKGSGFQVTTAANVGEALGYINAESFDVLLCDLHMPDAGDGFTVVSAMRHINPKTITLVFTGYPALREAMDAILSQADEVLVKPMPIPDLLALIHEKLETHAEHKVPSVERVAAILERDAPVTINNWLDRVEHVPELTRVRLNREQRTGHLPKLLQELVGRLRAPRALGTNAVSQAAIQHGVIRRKQGYSIPMIIEESRILQVTIFETLQSNLSSVDFSSLLTDVMTIADEVDAQLKQTITSFSESAAVIAA